MQLFLTHTKSCLFTPLQNPEKKIVKYIHWAIKFKLSIAKLLQ